MEKGPHTHFGLSELSDLLRPQDLFKPLCCRRDTRTVPSVLHSLWGPTKSDSTSESTLDSSFICITRPLWFAGHFHGSQVLAGQIAIFSLADNDEASQVSAGTVKQKALSVNRAGLSVRPCASALFHCCNSIRQGKLTEVLCSFHCSCAICTTAL